MSNSAEQLIIHAALLLRDEEDAATAEATLREAIELAVVANHPLELIQAKTFLGELLVNTDRADEAEELFEEVLLYAPHSGLAPTLIENELAAVNELLARIRGE